MPIADFGSVGDFAAFNNTKALTDAGSDLLLEGARNHQAHNNRMHQMAETAQFAWNNHMISVDPVEAAAGVKMMTGRESQGVGESIALVGMLAKIFERTPPAGSGS